MKNWICFSFLLIQRTSLLVFFLSKSTHNTKSFLNVNCNDDSWDRRRELEEREILFHLFFYSIFCLLFCQPVYHQIHRKLRSFNGQLRALLLYKIKTAAPLSALSPPSHLLPNPTTQNRSAVWLSRRQTDLLFFRHFLDFEFEFHEIFSYNMLHFKC